MTSSAAVSALEVAGSPALRVWVVPRRDLVVEVVNNASDVYQVDVPDVGEPRAGMKPRWAHSWVKGRAWAREQVMQHPTRIPWADALGSIHPADRKVVQDNLTGHPEMVRRKLRSTLAQYIRPAALYEAEKLLGTAKRKERENGTPDQRAFWHGVIDFTSDMQARTATDEGFQQWSRFLVSVESRLGV